jgi:hypothetical protein
MSSPPDPRRTLLRQLGGVVVVGVVGLALVAWWGLAPLPAPAAPRRSSAAPVGPVATLIDRDRWAAVLWRPFTDQQAAPVAAAPPPNVRLFSIMSRDRTAVAALDLGSSEGLVYLKAGETSGVVTVTAIDRSGATVSVAGRSVRLEMTP